MAALALTNIVTDTKKIRLIEEVTIQCSAPDLDILFFDWINAIIYEMETRTMLFSQFNVRIQNLKLWAKIKGETIDRNRHSPVVDVKGATFTELCVHQSNQRWIAQCVVDV